MRRLFDVRDGEAPGPLVRLASLLMLILAAHAVLETARDTLLLTGPGAHALGFVYIAIAACTVPCAALAGFAAARLGQRITLLATLAVAVVGPLVLYAVPESHASAMVTYVLSGVVVSIAVPLFWTLVGSWLTVAQGRRLFGLISAAGILGSVLGPAAAAGTLAFLPAKGLLVLASTIFAMAAGVLLVLRTAERTPALAPEPRAPIRSELSRFRHSPFLLCVALSVFISTATFFALDYLFKSTLARDLPHATIGRFIARYYLVLNGVSFVVQLASGTIIRRLGVLPALVPTPLLIAVGALVALVGGGGLPAVLFVKGIDGSLRYSIRQVTGELIFLPVPLAVRQRAKPLIDGGLSRIAQMATGGALLALGGTGLLGPRPLAAIVMILAVIWLGIVLSMRGPYLANLRASVQSGAIAATTDPRPMELESADALVECLASTDMSLVLGALTALAQRGRGSRVPALVLLHDDPAIRVQALDLFGQSIRTDWFSLARRLLGDPREAVRVAAARALSRHDQLDATSLANDVGARARGYAAVRLALRDPSTEVVDHPSVRSLLAEAGEPGRLGKLGMAAAIADARPDPRLARLLRVLCTSPPGPRERTELLARAATAQADPSLIPFLASCLATSEGREAARVALVTLGGPAFDELLRTLRDVTAERRLRLQMPKTLARFASPRAALCLLREVETETDGLLRYKSIRALRLLATEHRVRVDRRRVEAACYADLSQYFGRLAQCLLFDVSRTSTDAATMLLAQLLSERSAQALERAFYLLQIAHPRRGVHRAYIASRSADAYARAGAAELVDTLLRRRDQRGLRALFRVATDDLAPAERVERARSILPSLVRTEDEGLQLLAADDDPVLAGLAERLERGMKPMRAPLASGFVPRGAA